MERNRIHSRSGDRSRIHKLQSKRLMVDELVRSIQKIEEDKNKTIQEIEEEVARKIEEIKRVQEQEGTNLNKKFTQDRETLEKQVRSNIDELKSHIKELETKQNNNLITLKNSERLIDKKIKGLTPKLEPKVIEKVTEVIKPDPEVNKEIQRQREDQEKISSFVEEHNAEQEKINKENQKRLESIITDFSNLKDEKESQTDKLLKEFKKLKKETEERPNTTHIRAGGSVTNATLKKFYTKKEVDDLLSALEHGDLVGLLDDDHTQYALLAGRSGGQILTGGTGSGDILQLVSTSNATKGTIFTEDILNLGSNTQISPAQLHITYSNNDTTGNKYGEFVAYSYTPAATSTGKAAGLGFTIQSSGSETLNGQLAGVDGVVFHDGTGTLATALAANYIVDKTNTGPVTIMYGINIAMRNLNATGSVTNAIGYQLTATATGTMTNIFGGYYNNLGSANTVNNAAIYIADQTGSSGVNLGIYQLGGSNIHNVSQTANADMQYYGQTDADLFWIDVSEDSVGIGTSTPASKLHVSGSFGHKVTTVTASTHAAGNETVILCNATSNNITVNLPAASGVTDRIYHIKKTDSSSNTVTIDGNASEVVENATTAVISTQYDSIQIVCDGSSWWII